MRDILLMWRHLLPTNYSSSVHNAQSMLYQHPRHSVPCHRRKQKPIFWTDKFNSNIFTFNYIYLTSFLTRLSLYVILLQYIFHCIKKYFPINWALLLPFLLKYDFLYEISKILLDLEAKLIYIHHYRILIFYTTEFKDRTDTK